MNPTLLSNIFGVCAGLTTLLAYFFYLRQAIKGQSTPNPSTWLIWFIAGLINTYTYFTVVKGNIWQSIFAITVTTCVLVILVYALCNGKFTHITSVEVVTFSLAVIIGIFWQITANDRLANLLLQSVYIISYVPTVNGLLRHTAREHYASWLASFVAYSFATLAVLTNYQGDWIAFANPFINGILGNALIVILIVRGEGKK